MVQAFGHIVELLLVQYVLEHIAVISVAAHHDALFHVDGALVHVAAQFVSRAKVVTLMAGVGHFRAQHALLQADESIDQLEHAAGRIRCLHRAVVHGLVRVTGNVVPIFADIGQHAHVDTRGRYQRQNLSGRGFDGHDAAHLVLHQLLPQLLEVGVDGGDDVPPRDGFFVLGAVLVGLLNLVAGVAQVDVVAFLSAELGLPGGFDARHAGIVSAEVLSGMAVDVAFVHLRHVS